MNPQNTDEHHIKQSKHHLKNFKVSLKCSEAISEFTIIDQTNCTIGCRNQEKVIEKIRIEAPKHKKLKSKGMEPAKKSPEAADCASVFPKAEKAVQKRKHTKLEEHTSVRKQKKKPDVRLKNPEILPNSQDPEPLYTEDQSLSLDGPQNDPFHSTIVKESVSGSVLHSLQSLCQQINPFMKADKSQTIPALCSHEVPKTLQPELEEKCNSSSDYQDADDHLSSSPSVVSKDVTAQTDETTCVENQSAEQQPVSSKLITKEQNSNVTCSSLKPHEVSISDSSLMLSSNNHTSSLTSDTCDKLVTQETPSIEVNTEKFKPTIEVPFVSLIPPKPSEFGLKHCDGSSYKVIRYTAPVAVQTKPKPSKRSSSDNESSSSSAVTIIPALSRLSPQTWHSIPRRDVNTSRRFHSFSTSSSSHGRKPKKVLRFPKMKKARKPEPYRRSQSKYKIYPVKPKSKNEIPYMVQRFLKSNEVSGRVDETPKAKSFLWNQYRSFMRPLGARGLEFSKDPLHAPDVISSQQLLSYASYPVPSHLIGFKNFGNTCYMNATLQALTGLTKFCDGMLALQTEPGMVNYLKQLLSVHQEGIEPTSALKAFREYFITEVFPQFDNCNQQDASEFLITLINQGIKETNLFHDFFQFKYIEEIKCKKCVKVTCSAVQEDVMLNLMIPKQEFGIGSVQALMRNQLTTCQICKSESASCSFKFITLPRVLVLVMQRYCHTPTDGNDSRQVLKKIKTPFNLSHTLQVQHLVQTPEIFCSQTASITGLQNTSVNMESKSQPQIREFEASHVLQYYHLSAVVCHIGDGTNIGHYLADVYRPNMDGWYHYNDEAVSCTTFDHPELKENCYLLFYSLNK